MVAAAITLLIPGAGPPPTRIPIFPFSAIRFLSNSAAMLAARGRQVKDARQAVAGKMALQSAAGKPSMNVAMRSK
jgi:hypothetical protein